MESSQVNLWDIDIGLSSRGVVNENVDETIATGALKGQQWHNP